MIYAENTIAWPDCFHPVYQKVSLPQGYIHVVCRRDKAGIMSYRRSKMHRVCGATAGQQGNLKDVNKCNHTTALQLVALRVHPLSD